VENLVLWLLKCFLEKEEQNKHYILTGQADGSFQ